MHSECIIWPNQQRCDAARLCLFGGVGAATTWSFLRLNAVRRLGLLFWWRNDNNNNNNASASVALQTRRATAGTEPEQGR